jgi:hypothetical protein
VDALGATAASRRLVLETNVHGRWSPTASSATDSAGRAVWKLRLKPGSHRLRVRFAGTGDLAAATSRPVSVRIP